MKLSTQLLTGVFILFISIFLSLPAIAEEADSDSDDQDTSGESSSQGNTDEAAEAGMLEEVLITGSRSQRGRTATDSTVPIDSFSADDLNQESVGVQPRKQ